MSRERLSFGMRSEAYQQRAKAKVCKSPKRNVDLPKFNVQFTFASQK